MEEANVQLKRTETLKRFAWAIWLRTRKHGWLSYGMDKGLALIIRVTTKTTIIAMTNVFPSVRDILKHRTA